ncbi:lipase family protein [Nocardia sp. NPDC051052]|uniref:lipase family protein n=1 Tax=Nocardia sp. NPDC051052 TaxID=3364322 RepID=UPI00378E1CF1
MLVSLAEPVPAVAAPLLPYQDPFYEPPPNFEAAAPGTVLRTRPIELNFPSQARSWQLLYRTTDMFDRPDVTVTTVILPDNVAPDRPLVSVQPFEDASGSDCVPSYRYQAGSDREPVTSAQTLYLAQALQRGWVVSVPDFEGRFGHLGVAKEPGYMILDSVRAAEQFAPLGLGPDTRVGMFGYSGGALASGWAAEMQPHYAPELNIAGVAVGAPVTDVAAFMRTANGGPFAGIVAAGLASEYAADPAVIAALGPHLMPETEAVFRQINSQCLFPIVQHSGFQDGSPYFDRPLDQLLALPELNEILSRNSLNGPAPIAPMFIAHAVHDEVVPVTATDNLVQTYCDAGTPVTYLREQVGEHLSTGFSSLAAGYAWLQQRLPADAPTPTGCSTRTVTSLLLPN